MICWVDQRLLHDQLRVRKCCTDDASIAIHDARQDDRSHNELCAPIPLYALP
jgi:hypothetical protein